MNWIERLDECFGRGNWQTIPRAHATHGDYFTNHDNEVSRSVWEYRPYASQGPLYDGQYRTSYPPDLADDHWRNLAANLSDHYTFVRPFKPTQEGTMTDTMTEPIVEQPTPELLAERLATAERELDSLRSRCDQLNSQAVTAQNDWDLLAGRILQEAIDRDWCGEYDSIVDAINGSLRHFEMPTRNQRYHCSFTVEANSHVDMYEVMRAVERTVDDWSGVSDSGSYNYEHDSDY